MAWDDDDLSWAGSRKSDLGYSYLEEETKKKVAELLKKTNNGFSIVWVGSDSELKDAYKELDAIQKECIHKWKVLLMFNFHRRYCDICSKEDMTYVHRE